MSHYNNARYGASKDKSVAALVEWNKRMEAPITMICCLYPSIKAIVASVW